jgi:hypothetical protein
MGRAACSVALLFAAGALPAAFAADSPTAAPAAETPAAAPAKSPAKPSLKAEIEYVDRLIALDDSAAAHVGLAKWCESSGLAERARVHWREALDRDPENAEARAAAGFVKKDGAWVPASEAAPPGKAPAEAPAAEKEPDWNDRVRAAAQEIREIHRQFLIPSDAERWETGRRRLLALHDAAAAEPIARLLGRDEVEVRMLACEALGGIPGDTSLRYLLGFLLADDSPSVYLQALEGLKRRPDDRIVQQLIYAVARTTKPAMERAAFALGELGAEKAIPALISNLRAPEHERVLVKKTIEPQRVISGTVTAYIADLRPIVVHGAVAYKPVVGYVGMMNGIGGDTGPREVVVERDRIRLVEQPAVLEALKAITGMDFGYNIVEWRRWLARREAEAEAAAAPDAPPK